MDKINHQILCMLLDYVYITIYSFLLRKPEGKGPHGRPSRKWEGNFKMDLEITGWGV